MKQRKETTIVLKQYTRLLFLIHEYFKAKDLPKGWGMADVKNKAEKKLRKYVKEHLG